MFIYLVENIMFMYINASVIMAITIVSIPNIASLLLLSLYAFSSKSIAKNNIHIAKTFKSV